MANFKRPKTKRRVRCTMCTTYKWMGNNKGRFASVISENRDKQKLNKNIRMEVSDMG